MTKKLLKERCARARVVTSEIERLSAERKAYYEEHDEIAVELENVKGIEAFGVEIDDVFKKKNTQWGLGPVRRLKIKIIEPQKKAA